MKEKPRDTATELLALTRDEQNVIYFVALAANHRHAVGRQAPNFCVKVAGNLDKYARRASTRLGRLFHGQGAECITIKAFERGTLEAIGWHAEVLASVLRAALRDIERCLLRYEERAINIQQFAYNP